MNSKPRLLFLLASLAAANFIGINAVDAKSKRSDFRNKMTSENYTRDRDDDDDDGDDDRDHSRESRSERDSKRACLFKVHKETRDLYRLVKQQCDSRTNSSQECSEARAELELRKDIARQEIQSCLAGEPIPTDSTPPPPTPNPDPTPTPEPPKSCALNGQTVSSGSSVTAYQSSSVAFGQSCQSQTRECQDGNLSGTYQHLTCTVSVAPPPTPVNCQFNGGSVSNGQGVTAYQSSSVSFGQTCVSQTRTCTNGSLSGTYQYASCTVAPAASCQFNGQSIVSGQSITAYQSSNEPFGGSCSSQARTCTNGTLSGSYQFASCSVATAPEIDGSALYTQKCAACHGSISNSSVRGSSSSQITSALQNVGSMRNNSNLMGLTPAEISAIANALGSR